jgi:hypothetical protein
VTSLLHWGNPHNENTCSGVSAAGELRAALGQYGQAPIWMTVVVVSPKHTHRPWGQAQTAWYCAPLHVSWIVEEHEPLPEPLSLPVIMQPGDASGGDTVPPPPPGLSTMHPQSPPAWRRQVASDPAFELPPPVTTGEKQLNGVPPPLTQLIADTIDLLQEQSWEHAFSAAEQPISTQPQHLWNEGTAMESSKFGGHGPDDPEEPPLDPENPPDALDPIDPLDALDPTPTPLDPIPLDPLELTPLDPTPLDPTPEEEPIVPLEAPEEDGPLPGDPPSVPSSRMRSLRPQADTPVANKEARRPIPSHPERIADCSFRGRPPLGSPTA